MPSAANIKVDKQITSETASVDSASNQQNTPIRQAIVVIEHKIRNLEKRKAKLESYRELQSSGKDLNQDQKVAVAKYDEVVQTLEFARDLCKQFQGIAAVADKEAKKTARKEQAARSQQELAKMREVLLVQDALTQLGVDTVREDFLLGRNGAVLLTDSDLKLLDDLYPEVSPKHEPGMPTNFTTQVQTAAEHLLAVVDGKPKEILGTSYSHIKEVIGKIHESGYFDQSLVENEVVPEYVEEFQEVVVVEENPEIVEPVDEDIEDSIPVYQVERDVPVMAQAVEDTVPVIVPVVAIPPVIDPQEIPQQTPQQFYQQPRPISEVLGTGTFYFLQDSELDSPPEQTAQNPVTASAIPSQIFTNQNMQPNPIAGFPGAAQLNPPPPIPMPPSHIIGGIEYPGPAPAGLTGYAGYVPPPVVVPDEPIQTHVVVENVAAAPVLRNGNNDENKHKDSHLDDASNHVSSPKHNGPRPQRNNNNQQQQRRNGPHGGGGGGQGGYNQQQQQQPYYSNNGYNRQRPSRGGGPRPGGNRGPTQNNPNRSKQQPQQAQH